MKELYKPTNILLILILSSLVSCRQWTNPYDEGYPVFKISKIYDIGTNSVKIEVQVTDEGVKDIKSLGICYGSNPQPEMKGDDVNYTEKEFTGAITTQFELTDLEPSNRYYLRAFAQKNYVTYYSDEIVFSTYYSFVDYQGFAYPTVKVAGLIWMAQNLRADRLNDNTQIPEVSDISEWSTTVTPAYCLYDNDNNYRDSIEGFLYNYFTVDTRKLCPTGWHVANSYDWDALNVEISADVSKLKERGYGHWVDDGIKPEGTDEFSFNARPNGYRKNDGTFSDKGYSAYWWGPDFNDVNPIGEVISYNSDWIWEGETHANNGMAVRCVSDETPQY